MGRGPYGKNSIWVGDFTLVNDWVESLAEGKEVENTNGKNLF